jgi:hypothetical protein
MRAIERKYVSRAREVAGPRVIGNRGMHRRRSVRRGNARRDTVARLDRDRESGSKARGVFVVRDHHREVQPLERLFGEREADQSPAEFRHEIDRFRSHFFGRDAEVPLVLPIGIVDEDDHLAAADVCDGGFDGSDRLPDVLLIGFDAEFRAGFRHDRRDSREERCGSEMRAGSRV